MYLLFALKTNKKQNMLPRLRNILTLFNLCLFLLAVSLIILNIHDRYFTNKTSVSTESVKMSERSFPVSISIVVNPGFEEEALQEAGYHDTYNYFAGRSKYDNGNIGWAGHTADGGVIDDVSGTSFFSAI